MISVIIPTRNEAATLPVALAELLAQSPDEILLADGGSSDETATIAAADGARVLSLGPGRRAAQLNLAAAEAKGDVLLFLHADSKLPDGALQAIREQLATHPEVVGGCFRMRLDHSGWAYRFASRGGDLYCRLTHTLFGDRAIFVRKSDFAAVGGFPELAVMEEVALGRRLGRLGRLALLRPTVVSSARHFVAHGVWTVTWRAVIACLAFDLGVSTDWIARYYYGRRAPRAETEPARCDG